MNWGSGSVDKKSLYSDHVIRHRDVRDDSETDKCKEFEQGNPERREFYSPNYPGNYTKNTECVRLLEGRKLFPSYLFSVVYVLAFLKNCDCKNIHDVIGSEVG